jgi:hypothetical protein
MIVSDDDDSVACSGCSACPSNLRLQVAVHHATRVHEVDSDQQLHEDGGRGAEGKKKTARSTQLQHVARSSTGQVALLQD